MTAMPYVPPSDIRLEDSEGNFVCFSDYRDPMLNLWIRSCGQRILVKSLPKIQDEKKEKP